MTDPLRKTRDDAIGRAMRLEVDGSHEAAARHWRMAEALTTWLDVREAAADGPTGIQVAADEYARAKRTALEEGNPCDPREWSARAAWLAAVDQIREAG